LFLMRTRPNPLNYQRCRRSAPPYVRMSEDHGINESWATLREKLKQQCRITATFKQRDGKTLHIRQASRPEEELGDIYKKLGLSPDPGGLQRVRI
jgi:hypothetical protein